jgi:hypothetical protein
VKRSKFHTSGGSKFTRRATVWLPSVVRSGRLGEHLVQQIKARELAAAKVGAAVRRVSA